MKSVVKQKSCLTLLANIISVIIAALFMVAMPVFAEPSTEWAQQTSGADPRVADLLKPLPEDRVFYRWGSEEMGKRILKEGGRYSDELFRHFLATPDSQAVGPGLYVAAKPTGSASFLREGSAGARERLIEVRIAKGTPFLDFEDSATYAALQKRGIGIDQLKGAVGRNLLIRFNEDADWWVVKRQKGVEFGYFKPSRFSAKDLIQYGDELRGRNNKAAYEVFLTNTRETLAQAADVDPVLATSRTVQDALNGSRRLELVEGWLAKEPNLRDPRFNSGVFEMLKGDPKIATRWSARAEAGFVRLMREADSPSLRVAAVEAYRAILDSGGGAGKQFMEAFGELARRVLSECGSMGSGGCFKLLQMLEREPVTFWSAGVGQDKRAGIRSQLEGLIRTKELSDEERVVAIRSLVASEGGELGAATKAATRLEAILPRWDNGSDLRAIIAARDIPAARELSGGLSPIVRDSLDRVLEARLIEAIEGAGPRTAMPELVRAHGGLFMDMESFPASLRARLARGLGDPRPAIRARYFSAFGIHDLSKAPQSRAFLEAFVSTTAAEPLPPGMSLLEGDLEANLDFLSRDWVSKPKQLLWIETTIEACLKAPANCGNPTAQARLLRLAFAHGASNAKAFERMRRYGSLNSLVYCADIASGWRKVLANQYLLPVALGTTAVVGGAIGAYAGIAKEADQARIVEADSATPGVGVSPASFCSSRGGVFESRDGSCHCTDSNKTPFDPRTRQCIAESGTGKRR